MDQTDLTIDEMALDSCDTLLNLGYKCLKLGTECRVLLFGTTTDLWNEPR